MSGAPLHLAQINIGRGLASLDDNIMDGFVSQIDRFNRLAGASPGFVWRLEGEGGVSSSYLGGFEDPRMMANLSVWASVEALRDYAYRSAHVDVLRERRKWFEDLPGPVTALWWIPAGSVPDIAEGRRHLAALAREGASAFAFDFKNVFQPRAEE